MAKNIFTGVNSVARKVPKAYIGVSGVARKIKKAYIGDANGKARLFFAGLDIASIAITYTGNYTDKVVTINGKTYRLLTLTSSGTLTLEESVTGDVWMVGGGSSGQKGQYSPMNGGNGGGGGMSRFDQNITIAKTNTAVIGSGGTATTDPYYGTIGGQSSFNNLSTPVPSYFGNGGSGGGQGGNNAGNSGSASTYSGTGDGLSKWPFEVANLSGMNLHSGGGGGGTMFNEGNYYYYYGGNGGSNGSGGKQDATSYSSSARRTGGTYGGGTGGFCDECLLSVFLSAAVCPGRDGGFCQRNHGFCHLSWHRHQLHGVWCHDRKLGIRFHVHCLGGALRNRSAASAKKIIKTGS